MQNEFVQKSREWIQFAISVVVVIVGAINVVIAVNNAPLVIKQAVAEQQFNDHVKNDETKDAAMLKAIDDLKNNDIKEIKDNVKSIMARLMDR